MDAALSMGKCNGMCQMVLKFIVSFSQTIERGLEMNWENCFLFCKYLNLKKKNVRCCLSVLCLSHVGVRIMLT